MHMEDSKTGRAVPFGSATRALSLMVMFGLLALVLVGLLLAADTTQAQLKTTAVVSAWDYTSGKYENGNVNVAFNGAWVPFIHQKDWDTTLVTTTLGPAACQTTGTRYAGIMLYTLGYTDTNGAMGFRETHEWRLIDCDLNGDGKILDKADLAIFPPNGTNNPPPYPLRELAPCAPGDPICDLRSQDVVVACTQNTCSYEIQTTFFLNLDTNCDGTPDILPASGNPSHVCFYAEALTPKLGPADLVWGGNLQTRISDVGGDKTVNFSVDGWPTAIDLASFSAAAQANGVLLTWETASELQNMGFRIYRAGSMNAARAQLSQGLILSQMPGSAIGATYTFADESAVPGRRYYYWLEDVDVHGTATLHGPVTAKVASGKALPGRARPAPVRFGSRR